MRAEGQRGSLRRIGGRWVPTGGDDGSVAVMEPETAKPWKTATRAEWDDYARSQGVDPDEFKSKDALIDALG